MGLYIISRAKTSTEKPFYKTHPLRQVIRLVRKFSEKQLLGGVLVGVLSFICRK